MNGDVEYSITGGDTEGRFTIGATDGVIRTALPLDREAEATYNLAISSTDLAVREVDRLTTSAMVNTGSHYFTKVNVGKGVVLHAVIVL